MNSGFIECMIKFNDREGEQATLINTRLIEIVRRDDKQADKCRVWLTGYGIAGAIVNVGYDEMRTVLTSAR